METTLIQQTTENSHIMAESNGEAERNSNVDPIPNVDISTRIKPSSEIVDDILNMEEEYMNGSRKTKVADIKSHIKGYLGEKGKVLSPKVIQMSDLVAATSMLGIKWVKNSRVLIPVMRKVPVFRNVEHAKSWLKLQVNLFEKNQPGKNNTEPETGDNMFASKSDVISLAQNAKDNAERVLIPSRSAPQVSGTPMDEQLWLGKVRPAVGQIIKYSFRGTGQTSQEGSISDVNATNNVIGNQDPKPADLFINPSTSKQLVPASLNPSYAGDRIAHSQSANNSTAMFEPANHPVTNSPCPCSTHTGPKKGKKKRQKIQPYYKKPRKPNDLDQT